MPRAERERLHAKKTFLVQQEELLNIIKHPPLSFMCPSRLCSRCFFFRLHSFSPSQRFQLYCCSFHTHLISPPSSHPPQFCTPFFIFLTVLQSHTPPLQNVQGVWWTQEGARRGLRLKVEGYRGEEDPRCFSRGHKCHYDRSCTGLSSLPSCTRAHTVRAP